jgi:hypothetical protein
MVSRWIIFVAACLPFVVGCGDAAQSSGSVTIRDVDRTIPKPLLEAAKKRAATLNPQSIRSLRQSIQQQVTAGFDTPEQITAMTIEQNANFLDGKIVKPVIEQILKESLAEHFTAQQNWPTITDCDRLDQAFRALEAEGLFCRQNVRTQGSCGLILIKSEIEEQKNAGRQFVGYLIYYSLDTDFAVEGRGLNLTFDSIQDDDEPTSKNKSAEKIGAKVIVALEANGLHPQWDGTMKSRIFVPMDWKRRR